MGSGGVRRKWAIVGCALAAVFAACGGSDDGSSGTKAARERAPAEPAVVEIGTYAVGRETRTYTDTSRPTDPNGSFPGSDERVLLTTFYYPTSGEPGEEPLDGARPLERGGPFPLLLFSHGATARGVFYESVLELWASAGYVIAAPDYPLSSTTAPGGPSLRTAVGDVDNQPADATFIIDEILAADRSGELLGGIVDPERIGASGHSNGGITTFGLVYSSCCVDERVDAAIPMSGIAGLVDGAENYFRGIDTPLLVLHGDADPLVPYQAGVNAFTNASPPKFLMTFTGAGHVSPFLGGEDAQADALYAASVAFFDRYLKGDADGLERLRDSASPAAVATLQEEAGEER